MSIQAHPLFPLDTWKKPAALVNLSHASLACDPGVENPLLSLHSSVEREIGSRGASWGYGGYSEKRSFYAGSKVFHSEAGRARNIHLGVDFWLPSGTRVLSPLKGIIHSFQNNGSFGDYGPTLILEHQVPKRESHLFYTLYGHLSSSSLIGKEVGKPIANGEEIGTLGAPSENVGWPPHLHFQVILDLGSSKGDFPGVCFEEELDHYWGICPDPMDFFKWDPPINPGGV